MGGTDVLVPMKVGFFTQSYKVGFSLYVSLTSLVSGIISHGFYFF